MAHIEYLFTLDYEREGYRNLLPIYKPDLNQATEYAMSWISRMGSGVKYVGMVSWPHGMVIRNTRLPGVIERD